MVEGVGVSDEQLDEWERLARAATPGPWHVGSGPLRAGVKPEMFGEGRCGYCGNFELLWIGRADINGKMMTAHHHADSNPDIHSVESGGGDLIAGQFDTERGGVVSPEDTVFIAATRDAMPALIGEVRASHAREAAARADAKEADYVCRATGDKLAAVRGQRDVLRQRIDKALEQCADSVFALKPPCHGLVSIESVRAALTGTDNQSTEETP